ncbi:hypothetical protein D3C85_1527010 [compost metagenome]
MAGLGNLRGQRGENRQALEDDLHLALPQLRVGVAGRRHAHQALGLVSGAVTDMIEQARCDPVMDFFYLFHSFLPDEIGFPEPKSKNTIACFYTCELQR